MINKCKYKLVYYIKVPCVRRMSSKFLFEQIMQFFSEESAPNIYTKIKDLSEI